MPQGNGESDMAEGAMMIDTQMRYIDTAKMFFLLGAQAEELAEKDKRTIDMPRAWQMMSSVENVDAIKKDFPTFLQYLFDDSLDAE
jgi:hypothetical protein